MTVGLLKRCYSDHNCLHSVLGVIKILAGNSYDTYNYYACLCLNLSTKDIIIILYTCTCIYNIWVIIQKHKTVLVYVLYVQDEN